MWVDCLAGWISALYSLNEMNFRRHHSLRKFTESDKTFLVLTVPLKKQIDLLLWDIYSHVIQSIPKLSHTDVTAISPVEQFECVDDIEIEHQHELLFGMLDFPFNFCNLH